jgi:hypothetical protein
VTTSYSEDISTADVLFYTRERRNELRQQRPWRDPKEDPSYDDYDSKFEYPLKFQVHPIGWVTPSSLSQVSYLSFTRECLPRP